jgi:hypothetical protein
MCYKSYHERIALLFLNSSLCDIFYLYICAVTFVEQKVGDGLHHIVRDIGTKEQCRS